MAWKQQRTRHSVDIELDEFSCDQLLQELIHAGWLNETEAEAISKRHASKEKHAPVLGLDPDAEELAEAKHCIAIGWRNEALIHLERFLGREFVGRLAS